jgi:hypothetical protein
VGKSLTLDTKMVSLFGKFFGCFLIVYDCNEIANLNLKKKNLDDITI